MVAITGEGSRLVQLGLDKELVEDFSDFREGYLGATREPGTRRGHQDLHGRPPCRRARGKKAV